MKWIVITSDAMSSGKTVFAAYIAALLDRNKIEINFIKLNPALSIKLGLLSPESVGEAFITYDGGQVDKDIGIIERSTSYNLPANSCLTLGHAISQVNLTELDSKDCGYEFLSIDTHLIDFIYQYIKNFKDHVVNLIEIGGSVNESGSGIFCYAVKRLMKSRSVYSIHIGDNTASFGALFGANPSIFVDYTQYGGHLRYRLIDPPLETQLRGLLEDYLQVKLTQFDLTRTYLAPAMPKTFTRTVRIAVVGRYISNPSAYLSILDNLRAAAYLGGVNIAFDYIYPLYLNYINSAANLGESDGIIVPGGFGDCGNDGMVEAIRFARENGVPLLGICYGFQMMVVEFARHVCGMADAHTFEMSPQSAHPVIHQLGEIFRNSDAAKALKMLDEAGENPEGRGNLRESHGRLNESYNGTKEGQSTPGSDKYGIMNLGDCKIHVIPGTIAASAFEDGQSERHWHSYGVNMRFWPELQEHGLRASIFNEKSSLVLAVELRDSRYFFFGCQFHPEFRGNYNQSHRIFDKFLEAAKGRIRDGSAVKE